MFVFLTKKKKKMARVKGQKYPTTRRKAPVKRKKEEEEEKAEEVENDEEEEVEQKQQQQQEPVRTTTTRRRVRVLEFEDEKKKQQDEVVVIEPTVLVPTRRKGAAMSTGGVSAKTPETKKNNNDITTPPEAPVKVRVKFPQREREQQKRDREEEEERQASPSLDLPKKRTWVPPEIQLEEHESYPTGLDFTRDAILIKCCERVGVRRGWEYGRTMQAAYDLLLVLWCKKQVRHNREFDFSCPEDIDECWHEFVLNTVHYAQWSEQFGFFPNHTTFTSDDSDDAKMGRIQALMKFGRSRWIKFNSEFWPRVRVPVTPPLSEEVVPYEPNDDNVGLFDVYIQTLTGKTMTVRVTDKTTVLGLKQNLEVVHYFPTDAQRLIFAGHNMDDLKLLKDYGIGPYSKVHLVLRIGGGDRRGDGGDFQIFVKTTTDKTFTVRVMSTTTVAELKKKIKDKEGVPVDQQRVVFRGTELNDNYDMKKYNIISDVTVYLVVRLRGC